MSHNAIRRLTGSQRPYLIGIRHHSPALAVAIPPLLTKWQPQVLAIELPAEAQGWLEWLTDPRAKAPLAMAFSRGDGLRFYPFADFSPELAALRWAREHQVRVRCIDLPVGADPLPEDPGPLPAPGVCDPRGAMALAARARAKPEDSNEIWDRLIEANAPQSSPEQLRVAALAHGWAIREEEGLPDAHTLARERWMNHAIAEELAQGHRVAAVVGSFHAPALLAPRLAAATGNAAPVASCLVRYTFAQLDSRSGYPAGIRDPGWQQLVVEAGLDPQQLRSAATRLITQVARELRSSGHPAGPGEAAETARMALDLATLRGLPAPSRRELIEAVTSVLAQGEVLGRGRVVAAALEQVLIGRRSGEVAPGTPVSPLRENILAELAAAGLTTRRAETIELVPQRSTKDLTRQILLQRLLIGGISYAKPVSGGPWRGAKLIGLTWQLNWGLASEASVELAAAKGLTAEQVATTALLSRQVSDWEEARGLLVEAAECAIGPAVSRALAAITEQAGRVNFAQAVSVLDALASVVSEEIPGAALLGAELLGRAGQLRQEFTAAAVRELRGVEGSEDLADARALAVFAEHSQSHALSLGHALGQLLRQGSPLMQGAAAGLRIDDAELASRISSWLNAPTAASRRALRDRLAGLLATAWARFDTAPATQALVERVGLLGDEEFVGILPALRGGFDTLSPRARSELREELARRFGVSRELVLSPEETLAVTSYDTEARSRLALLGLTDLAFSPAERWRLILGTQRERLSGQGRRLASALDELYGRPDGDALDARHRGAAAGPSQLGVRQWREEIEVLFGQGQVTEIFGQAAAQGRAEVLDHLDPNRVRPSVELLATALSLTGALSEERLRRLRPLVARLVKELSAALAIRLRPALRGLASQRSTRRPNGQLDLPATLRSNLSHVVEWQGRAHVVPVHPRFHTPMQAQVDWHLIIVVDASGSMSESVVYSALTAAILAEAPALSVQFLAFDTRVVDFTGHINDPLSLLLEIDLGGGTDIAGALRVARSRVKVPTRTMLVLISDFEEPGGTAPLLGEVAALHASGVRLLGCAALNDTGTGAYHAGIAAEVAGAGMRVAAVSPLDLAHWVGSVLREAG